MELELKHITPYLPYGLSFSVNLKDVRDNFPDELRTLKLTEISIDLALKTGKLILRPLSSMTKKEAYEFGIPLMGEADMEDKEVGIGEMRLMGATYPTIAYKYKEDEEYSITIQFSSVGISGMDLIPYEAYEWLFKHHFDVFGLIGKGLAISK